jgi:hypothetical protein
VTDFSVVPTERLFEVLDVITPIEWPADAASTIPGIVKQLGWTMTKGDPTVHVRVESNLPVSFQRATFLIGNKFGKGELIEISFWVTDSVPKGGDVSGVRPAFRQIVKDLSGRFGKPSGKPDEKWWDLPTGGRLRVAVSSEDVTVDLLSRRYADVERAEEYYGVSDDRVLGEDE